MRKVRGFWVATVLTKIASPYVVPLLLVCVVLLKLPVLSNGLIADDFIHRSVFVNSDQLSVVDSFISQPDKSWQQKIGQMFSFLKPDRYEDQPLMKAYGALPWWSDDAILLNFFRPLSAITHWVDWTLWPDNTVMMNAHNTAWFVLALFMLSRLYLQYFDDRKVAMLALLFFTLDVSHIGTVSWIANRNSIIAIVFSIATLMYHHQYIRTGRVRLYFLANVMLALSLLAAEAGISTFAYLFAYALVLDARSLSKRSFSLLPYATVIVVWRVIYSFLGYGAKNVGAYTDPVRNPVEFFSTAFEKVPLYLFNQFSGFDYVASSLSSSATSVFALIALVLVIVFFVWCLPILLSSAQARFWTVGCLLSIVPICALAKPEARVMLYVSMGGMGLLAERVIASLRNVSFFSESASSDGTIKAKSSRLNRVMVNYALCAHLYISLIAWIVGAGFLVYHGNISPTGDQLQESIAVAPASSLAGKHLVVVNAPHPVAFVYLPFKLDARAMQLPRTMRVLSPAFSAVKLTRLDDERLYLQPEGGYLIHPDADINQGKTSLARLHPIYYSHVLATLFRGKNPVENKEFDFEEIKITVDRSTNGIPQSVIISINQDLNPNDYLWVKWDWQNNIYQEFELPEVGQSVLIKGPFDV